MKVKCLLLIMLVFATYEKENLDSNTKSEEKNTSEQAIVVKIEEDEYVKGNKKTSNYFGVHFCKRYTTWCTCRRSKNEQRTVTNGTYKVEETAAHASDTLARKLMANGEKGHKLNFPDDETEVNPEQKNNYFGVLYNEINARWHAYRYSKNEKRNAYNGCYNNEETAAHASDTLARKLIANGEKSHQLNFPDDDTEVRPEEVKFSSNYIGVTHSKRDSIWRAYRHSKFEKKKVFNGSYKDEETAAHASDTLARKLIANGEKGHKFNFPDDDLFPEKETYQRKKRKRHEKGNSQESKSQKISKN